MLVSRKIRYGNLLDIWFTNEEGMIENYQERIPDSEAYNWVEVKRGEHEGISWDGKKIRKQYVEPKKMSKYRIVEYMYETFNQELIDRIFSHKNPKRQFFCDIETEMIDNWDFNETDADKKIYSITLQCNSSILVLAVNELTQKQLEDIQKDVNEYFKQYGETFKVKFKYYEQEEYMLYDFFNFLCPKMDSITGWNFEEFDWKYMVCRARYLNVDIKHLKINSVYMPDNLIVVDYQKLCEKYEKSINMKESAKLNDVALQVCHLQKLKYDKDLTDLYTNNKQKFILYNIIDTLLVYFIDKLTRCFDVHCQINNISEAGIYKCFGSVAIIEPLMMKEFLKEGKHSFECYNDPRNDAEGDKRVELGGGFVFNLIPGFYKNIASLDFASLYPSLTMQFNICNSTLLGMDKDLDECTVKNNIRTSWGAVYRKDKKGILPMIVETNYYKRKVVQKEVIQDDILLEQINRELVKRNVIKE